MTAMSVCMCVWGGGDNGVAGLRIPVCFSSAIQSLSEHACIARHAIPGDVDVSTFVPFPWMGSCPV
jgi:hypothetical protein